jgi:hypothetical protein
LHLNECGIIKVRSLEIANGRPPSRSITSNPSIPSGELTERPRSNELGKELLAKIIYHYNGSEKPRR